MLQRHATPPVPPRRAVFARTHTFGIDPVWLVTALLVGTVLVWTTAILLLDRAQFALLSPRAHVGVESASAFARLFAALVLFLFPAERGRQRLRWVAAGVLVTGLGGLVFGYLQPLVVSEYSLNSAMYESLVVWLVAGLFFILGLVPQTPPRVTKRLMLWVAGAALAIGMLGIIFANSLPTLVRIDNLESATAVHATPLEGLTTWHWVLSSIPFLLAAIACFGAGLQYSRGVLGGWIVIAMVPFAGAKLHNMFWPSAYSPVLTTANLLRLAFAAIVCVAGVIELRRIAAERGAVAAAEREYANRLAELAVLRADFTAMVAHELGSPVAAIRGYTDMLSTGALDEHMTARAVNAIRTEAELLTTLVSDVRSIASVERHDFAVNLRPVSLNEMLDEAAAFARAHPGDRSVTIDAPDGVEVLADAERIGQVLRNLLSNAAKYSPPGSPITIRALPRIDGRVRIEVSDRGHGIHPDDLERVFEKFARGRDTQGNRVPGVGVGLYLSRRIAQLHGTDLTVTSELGVGSTFAFELEVVS